MSVLSPPLTLPFPQWHTDLLAGLWMKKHPHHLHHHRRRVKTHQHFFLLTLFIAAVLLSVWGLLTATFDIRDQAASLLTEGGSTTIEGTFTIIHQDDFEAKKSTNLYVVLGKPQPKKPGTNLNTDPTVSPTIILEPTNEVKELKPGSQVRVEVQKTKSETFSPRNITVLNQPAVNSLMTPLGTKKVAIILLQFTGRSANNTPTPEHTQFLFNGSIKPFFAENSYNQLTLNSDVFGWYTTSIAPTCDLWRVSQEAVRLADPQINFSQYQQILVIYPGSCSYSGTAFVLTEPSYTTAEGTFNFPTAGVINTYYESMHTATHELGHNYHMYHANGWECNLKMLGTGTIGGGCTSIEYGDSWDVMGTFGTIKHFGAYHKKTAQWLTPAQVPTIAQGAGTFSIYPIEQATPAGPRGVNVNIAGNTAYYIENRISTGYDIGMPTSLTQGAVIRLAYPEGNGDTQLVDGTPNSVPADFYDAGFAVGQSLVDEIRKVTIKVLSKTNNVLRVSVAYAPTPQSPVEAATVSRRPTLTWSPTPGSTQNRIRLISRCNRTNPPHPCVLFTKNISLSGNTTSYTLPNDLSANTRYTWELQSVSDTGVESPWSELRSFTTN